MVLKAKDSKEFDLALTTLANELVHANVFYKLFEDIKESFREYRNEVRESQTFWGLVHESLRESALIRLCRVYDDGPKKNSLPNILRAINENPHFFDLESYADRMKENEHIDPIERHQMPDDEQVNLDIEFVSENNPAVKKLIKWRNNLFVHRNSTLVIKGKNLNREDIPTFGDVTELLDKGMAIVNRYMGLFRSTTYSTQMIGYDDYKYVFKCLRNEAKRRVESLKLEYEAAGIPFPADEQL